VQASGQAKTLGVAQALAANDAGVTACATLAQAVQGAERIHLSLSDDASVDAVLEPLADALGKGTWIVDHTTTAVRPTAERAAAFKLFGNLTLLGILGILGDVGRLAAAVGIDMKDAFSLFEHSAWRRRPHSVRPRAG
jgi:hypothetical protein